MTQTNKYVCPVHTDTMSWTMIFWRHANDTHHCTNDSATRQDGSCLIKHKYLKQSEKVFPWNLTSTTVNYLQYSVDVEWKLSFLSLNSPKEETDTVY